MTTDERRNAWRRELQRTAGCIPIERLGEELTAEEHRHLAHCARCQAELALWERIDDRAQRPGEAAAVTSIAAELRRRMGAQPENVVPLRRPAPVARFRASLAAAAVLTVAVALGVFVTHREPSVPDSGTAVEGYRSVSVKVLEPVGDVVAAPAVLRWQPVTRAARYDVQVMEVDRTILWRGSTTDARAALPPALVARFVPGKTILWQVEARGERAIVAGSGIQRFRVRAAH